MIAGPGADRRRVDIARRVAEAEIDILRVRDARSAVQRATISDQYRHSTSETHRRLKQMLSSASLADAVLSLVDPIPPSEITEYERFSIRVDEATRELLASIAASGGLRHAECLPFETSRIWERRPRPLKPSGREKQRQQELKGA